jgi:galactose mutarotase-like enzyme
VYDTLRLAAGGTRVDIVPALGGKIVSLFAGGREWLWTNDVLPRVAPTPAVAADDAASYVLTADTGGYDECVPTVAACRLPRDVAGYGGLVLPDHGELWSQDARSELLDDDETGPAAITHWTGRRMPYGFTRTVRVDEDGEVLIDYALVNRGGTPLPFLWSSHPLLALTPDTRLDLPEGARVRVWSQDRIDLGGERAEHVWPRLTADGAAVDFTRPGRVREGAGWSCKLFVELPAHAPLVSLGVEQGGARLEVSLAPREVTHLGLWLNHGGWTPVAGGARYMNLGFEPCIGAPDALDAALGAWQGAAWLRAGATRRWTLEWRARPARPALG